MDELAFLEEYWVALFTCVLVGLLFVMLYNGPERKAQRLRLQEGKRMEDARRAYLNQLLADIITDGIDKAYLDGNISRRERADTYPWVGRRLEINDLYPRKLLQGLLKEQIDERLHKYHWDYEGKRKGVIIFPDNPGWKIKFQAANDNHWTQHTGAGHMRTGVITVTNPGFVAEEGYVEQALANNPTCMGLAVHDGEKIIISRLINPDMETVKKLGEGTKDFQVNTWMGSFPDGFLEDDVQPFSLVEDDKGNTVVAVMLDGDWANGGPSGSTHSDEFFVAMNHLRPMLTQLHRLTGGSVKLMIEEIDGQAGNNAITNLMVNRGAVHMIFNDGQVRTVVKNIPEKEFDWGWVSNSYLYSEEEPPVPVPLVKPNLLEALLGSKALLKKEPTLQVEPPVQPAEVKPEEVKPPVVVPVSPLAIPPAPSNPSVLPGETVKLIACPREIKNPKKVQGWYKHNCTHVPDNFMGYPEIAARQRGAGPVKDLQSLGEAIAQADKKTVLQDVKSTAAEVAARTPPKLVLPKNALPPIADTKPVVQVKKTTVSSMPPEVQKKVVDQFLKDTEKMVTQEGGPSVDDQRATFEERCGLKPGETFGWTVERLEKLLFEFPEAYLHLSCDWRKELWDMKKVAAAADTVKKMIVPKITLPPARKTG